jgi:hypothetical protein
MGSHRARRIRARGPAGSRRRTIRGFRSRLAVRDPYTPPRTSHSGRDPRPRSGPADAASEPGGPGRTPIAPAGHSRHGERPGDPPARTTGGHTAQRRTCPGPDDPSATGLDSPAPAATAAGRLGPARRPGVPRAARPGQTAPSGLRYAIARKVPCNRSWRTASEPVREIRRPPRSERTSDGAAVVVPVACPLGSWPSLSLGAYGSRVGAGEVPVRGGADPEQDAGPQVDEGPPAGAFGAVVVTT